ALPCEASTPLSVVDMDNDRNYKYFIGCNNGLIYGYEKGGKPLAGWNPNQLGSDVTYPIQYFRYRSREFLLGVTDDGWLKFFTRFGEQATKSIPIGNRTANHFVSDDEKGFRAIATDGTEYRLGYDGKIYLIASPMFSATDATFADIIPNKSGHEKIIFDGKRLGVYADDSTKVRMMNLPNETSGKIFTAQLPGGKYYIGVYGDKKIWLMDNEGKLVPGFPRKGHGKFIGTDLYNNEQLVIIGLVDERTVIAYAIE
ncbi:MAG TPA: hypothetical protein VD905_13955, partial [Flavobacteriales bacterium]|nr:hypothetical protein [Flavobacteriales bacterium]